MKNKITREIPAKFKSWKRKLDHWSVPAKVTFFILGIFSTAWFLIRVIPKPSRAAYPCMRTAAPFMSALIIYILSFSGAFLAFRKARASYYSARYAMAGVFALLSLATSLIFFGQDVRVAIAQTLAVTGNLPDPPNSPMGIGDGINPGRVAWVYNANATNINCTNGWGTDGKGNTADDDGYFLPKNTDKDVVKVMMDSAIINLTGEATVHDAWDKVFKHFNNKRGLGEIGYSPDQTIFIKVNQGTGSWLIDQNTMNPNSQAWAKANYGIAETTPQAILAVIHQLVTDYGVPEEMIYVGDPIAHLFQYTIDPIKAEYPNIKFFDRNLSKLGRTVTKGLTKGKVIYYSDQGKEMPEAVSDAMYQEMYDANYLINIAALKAHARAGITLCAKNHFGSHGRDGAPHLHPGLIAPENDIQKRTEYKMYRILVDLIGHEKLGGNTLLFIIDGLWGGPEATEKPVKWKMSPFNNDWPNSLLISQDQVALESVCLDFLRQEATVNTLLKNRPLFGAVDDYLHQAADKANWPVNIVYDPEDDGTPISSLGVHEHWNNATDKQYSRNLKSGQGIELISTPKSLVKNITTGISNIQTVSALSVYPNPATDHIQVKADFSGETSVELFIYNSTGQLIFQSRINQVLGAINQSVDLPKGMAKGNYILSLVGKKQKETTRFVVQ
jgi:hypothetical protein